MSVPDSPSNQVETEPPKAVTGRWELIIVTVGFVFPLIVMAIGTVSSELFFGRAPQILLSDRPVVRPSMFTVVCMVLLSCALCDWPFFVLAYRVEPTFRKYWPDAKAAHEAIIGGLIGISIPFVFFYACVGVISAQNSGGTEGMAVLLPIVWLMPDGLLVSAYELVAASEGVKCNRSALTVVIANRTGRPMVSISTNNGPGPIDRVARTSINSR